MLNAQENETEEKVKSEENIGISSKYLVEGGIAETLTVAMQ